MYQGLSSFTNPQDNVLLGTQQWLSKEVPSTGQAKHVGPTDSESPELSMPPGILLEMQILMLTLNLGKPKDGIPLIWILLVGIDDAKV